MAFCLYITASGVLSRAAVSLYLWAEHLDEDAGFHVDTDTLRERLPFAQGRPETISLLLSDCRWAASVVL